MPAEFTFELQLCQWAEQHWPPEGDRGRPVIVARQLGTKHRRFDTLVIECDPSGLTKRRHFGERRLDSDLLHVVRNAPAEWGWYQDVLPDPGYPWQYVREAVHRAGDRGLIEKRKRGNRIELREREPYPDWAERIIAIENKPDLDASAARDLLPQIERDVAMGLADEVWIATKQTDERIEPILLEDVPVEAGILTVDTTKRGPARVDVRWQPRSLAVDAPGTRILDRPDGGKYDASACRFEYAAPEYKASKRREIAERAYERGWRSYLDSMRPDCRYFELQPTAPAARPYCTARECAQTPGQCGSSCPEFEPEPPTWRQQGWPIDGGPGACIKRLLARQRERQRPTDGS